jgi:hypothetical protein
MNDKFFEQLAADHVQEDGALLLEEMAELQGAFPFDDLGESGLDAKMYAALEREIQQEATRQRVITRNRRLVKIFGAVAASFIGGLFVVSILTMDNAGDMADSASAPMAITADTPTAAAPQAVAGDGVIGVMPEGRLYGWAGAADTAEETIDEYESFDLRGRLSELTDEVWAAFDESEPEAWLGGEGTTGVFGGGRAEAAPAPADSDDDFAIAITEDAPYATFMMPLMPHMAEVQAAFTAPHGWEITHFFSDHFSDLFFMLENKNHWVSVSISDPALQLPSGRQIRREESTLEIVIYDTVTYLSRTRGYPFPGGQLEFYKDGLIYTINSGISLDDVMEIAEHILAQ